MTANDIADICYSYKYASSKPKMIRILSELYCCTVSDIKDLLRSRGFVIQERKSYECIGFWSDDEKRIVLEEMAKGSSYDDIVLALRHAGYYRTKQAVINETKKLKKLPKN